MVKKMNLFKKFKSQKGVTMVSLVIYVASFFAVTALIGLITTFFYNNVSIINTDLGSTSYYNKLNTYVKLETTKPGTSVYGMLTATNLGRNPEEVPFPSVTFQTPDGRKNTFLLSNGIIYYNNTALCKNVSRFDAKKILDSSGKTTVSIIVTINNQTFNTNYVIN